MSCSTADYMGDACGLLPVLLRARLATRSVPYTRCLRYTHGGALERACTIRFVGDCEDLKLAVTSIRQLISEQCTASEVGPS